MPRKPTEGGLTQLNLKIRPDLLAELDEEVARRQDANPDAMLTRSDVIRVALRELLDRSKAQRAK